MNLREIGWEGVDWMHLAQDRRSGSIRKFSFQSELIYSAFGVVSDSFMHDNTPLVVNLCLIDADSFL